MAEVEQVLVDGRELSTLRVTDLKAELEKRGLSKSGSKKELAARLKRQLTLESLQSSAVESDEDHVPNLGLKDQQFGQNVFIKQYLAQQQKTFEIQKEQKRKMEEEESAQSGTDHGEESVEEAGTSTPTTPTAPPAKQRRRSRQDSTPRKEDAEVALERSTLPDNNSSNKEEKHVPISEENERTRGRRRTRLSRGSIPPLESEAKDNDSGTTQQIAANKQEEVLPQNKTIKEKERGSTHREISKHLEIGSAPVEVPKKDDSESVPEISKQKDDGSVPPEISKQKDSESAPPEITKQKDSESASPEISKQKHSESASPEISKQKDSESAPPEITKQRDSESAPPEISKQKDSGSVPPEISKQKDSGSAPPEITKQKDDGSVPPEITKQKDDGSTSPEISKQQDSGSDSPEISKQQDSSSAPPEPTKTTKVHDISVASGEAPCIIGKAQVQSDENKLTESSINTATVEPNAKQRDQSNEDQSMQQKPIIMEKPAEEIKRARKPRDYWAEAGRHSHPIVVPQAAKPAKEVQSAGPPTLYREGVSEVQLSGMKEEEEVPEGPPKLDESIQERDRSMMEVDVEPATITELPEDTATPKGSQEKHGVNLSGEQSDGSKPHAEEDISVKEVQEQYKDTQEEDIEQKLSAKRQETVDEVGDKNKTEDTSLIEDMAERKRKGKQRRREENQDTLEENADLVGVRSLQNTSQLQAVHEDKPKRKPEKVKLKRGPIIEMHEDEANTPSQDSDQVPEQQEMESPQRDCEQIDKVKQESLNIESTERRQEVRKPEKEEVKVMEKEGVDEVKKEEVSEVETDGKEAEKEEVREDRGSRSRASSRGRSRSGSSSRSGSWSGSRSRSYSRSLPRSLSRSPPRSRSFSRHRSFSRSRSRSKDSSVSRSRSRSQSTQPEAKHVLPVARGTDGKENSVEVKSPKSDKKSQKVEVVEEEAMQVDKTEKEVQPLLPTEPPKIQLRKISLHSTRTGSTETATQKTGEQPTRKRRWGTARPAKRATLAISSDVLKDIIPDVKPDPVEPMIVLDTREVQQAESDSDVEEELPPSKLKKDRKENAMQMVAEKVSQKDVLSEEELDYEDEPQQSGDKENQAVEMKPKVEEKVVGKVKLQLSGALFDEPEAATQPPSPSRNPPSTLVHIRNLVRPFTLNQLKELLGRSGKLVDSSFWIDKIKSHCFAEFETVDEAMALRADLHGVKWPSSNPKVIRVDFTEPAELDFHRELTVKQDQKAEAIKEKLRHQHKEEKRRKKELELKAKETEEQARERAKRSKEEADRDLREVEKKKRLVDVREWDKDKIPGRSPPEYASRNRVRPRSPSAEGAKKDRSLSHSPSRDLKRRDRSRDRKEKKERKKEGKEEAPAKLLDDLFRKTKAVPCIYWLPLTDEQIAIKENERKQRKEEREKRQALMEKMEREKAEESRRKERETRRRSRSKSRSRSRRRR